MALQRHPRRGRPLGAMFCLILLLSVVLSGCGYIWDTVPSLKPGFLGGNEPTTTPTEMGPPTLMPTATLEPPPTLEPTADISACEINLAYVADVTIPDDTAMSSGETFVKTWEVRNTGTCAWTRQFYLSYVQGDNLGAVSSVPLPPTEPGDVTHISVEMRAPDMPGTYTSKWQLCAGGQCTGATIYARIVVN